MSAAAERWVRLMVEDGFIFRMVRGADPREPSSYSPSRAGSGEDRSDCLLAVLAGQPLGNDVPRPTSVA